MYGVFKGKIIRGETIAQIRALASKRGKGTLKIYSDGSETYKNPFGGKKIVNQSPMLASLTIR
jgi:hypothetical protein